MAGVPFPNVANDLFFVSIVSELAFAVVVVASSGPQLIQTMADFFPIITIDPTIPFPPNDDCSADGKASPIGIIGMIGSSRARFSTGTTPADENSAVVVDDNVVARDCIFDDDDDDDDDIAVMALLYLALLNYNLSASRRFKYKSFDDRARLEESVQVVSITVYIILKR
jgi:hypothetical protein